MINLAIFASGSGTNVENIAHHFVPHPTIQVKIIFSNKENAYVHTRAKRLGIPSHTFNYDEFQSPAFLSRLEQIDFIVLAGFLWLLPEYFFARFRDKIINIHPGLLPKFGGKGMYSHHVHKAVIASGETKSGITIHLVNEEYDQGKILFQAACRVEREDSPESLTQKIHVLEYKYFPKVIEKLVLKQPITFVTSPKTLTT